MAQENKNHFLYSRHFPDSSSILKRKGKSTSEIFKDALFVLDTNSLLVPYNTGKENIEEIRKVYQKLISKKRLFIPEHVLREFAKNRSFRISELYANIDNLLSSIPTIKSFEYPILGELGPYKKLKETRDAILENIKQYKDNLTDLKKGIVDWNWADPVTSMYQKTFTDEIIIKSSLTEEQLIEEYTKRIDDDIPPGNKDKSKEKNAIGDFVIWRSILELGKEKKRDIIFISNDEKNDWLLKGNQKSISTKFELVDEYYRYTDGHNFLSTTFNFFLENQGLDIDISEIFQQFADMLGEEIEKPKESSLKSLVEIERLINRFLALRNEDNEEVYIRGNINESITNFKETYRIEYFEKEEWRFFASYFFRFDSLLTEIKSLNSEIIYQEHRMKRDTRNEVVKLVALCKEFLDRYDEFNILT